MNQQPSDEQWMREALREGERAERHGDVPVGCIIVDRDSNELWRDHNRREQLQDPAAHAEVLALRGAARKIGHWRLDGATVYATLEPCPMCAGALINARIARVVYAAADPKAGAIDTLFSLGTDTRLNHRFSVTRGVLDGQGAALLQRFFARLRAQGQR